jgi:hypothetical protein
MSPSPSLVQELDRSLAGFPCVGATRLLLPINTLTSLDVAEGLGAADFLPQALTTGVSSQAATHLSSRWWVCTANISLAGERAVKTDRSLLTPRDAIMRNTSGAFCYCAGLIRICTFWFASRCGCFVFLWTVVYPRQGPQTVPAKSGFPRFD